MWNPWEWLKWFYESAGHKHPTISACVIILVFALLGFLVWWRLDAQYKKDHPPVSAAPTQTNPPPMIPARGPATTDAPSPSTSPPLSAQHTGRTKHLDCLKDDYWAIHQCWQRCRPERRNPPYVPRCGPKRRSIAKVRSRSPSDQVRTRALDAHGRNTPQSAADPCHRQPRVFAASGVCLRSTLDTTRLPKPRMLA
jgi:hypothetical protein